MEKVIAAARMILICILIAVYLLIIGVPALIYCRIVGNPRLGLRLARFLDRLVLFFAGIDVEIQGLDQVRSGIGYVYVCNHRSMVDPPVAFRYLPGDTRFLGKKELFQIPVVGFALRSLGMIEVDRGDPERAQASIDRAAKEIQGGRCVVLFPEGTRSRGGETLPFKKGAFVLAIRAEAPIVPVTFIGTEILLRPDSIFLYPGKVKMIIHDPIETTGLTMEDRDELLERARNVIVTEFERAR